MEATTFLFRQIKRKRCYLLFVLSFTVSGCPAASSCRGYGKQTCPPQSDARVRYTQVVFSGSTFTLAHWWLYQGEHDDVSNSCVQLDELGMRPVGSLQGCDGYVWEELALLSQGGLVAKAKVVSNNSILMQKGGSCVERAGTQSGLWGKAPASSCASQRGGVWQISPSEFLMLSIYNQAQVAEQRPEDASTCLLAARLCYEKLDLLSEGIAWAERALDREESVPQDLRARCHLYLGVGRYLQSYEVETREQRVGLCSSAGTHLVMAADIDPGDHLAQFYLGLHLATQRRLQEAHSAAQRALLLQPDHLPRWPWKLVILKLEAISIWQWASSAYLSRIVQRSLFLKYLTRPSMWAKDGKHS